MVSSDLHSRKFFVAARRMVYWEGPALGALVEVCGCGWVDRNGGAEGRV